ncbi:MAG: V-type proton ATPase subunit E [Oscillospiraceae bacterium]|nr:V-type proton ATPase subunit E [Oscillospiraceae bacterium]
MDGIQRIIDRIDADAAAECAAIAAEGERRCEDIRAEFSKAEQDAYWKVFNAGVRDVEQRKERLGSVAQLEAKKQVLATKQELIALAFERAAQMLSQLPEDRYSALLVRLAAEASGGAPGQLIFSKADRERLGQRVCNGANAALASAGKAAKITLSPETRDIRGGFVFSGGDIECNCSADALVGQHRNELSAKVAAALFD